MDKVIITAADRTSTAPEANGEDGKNASTNGITPAPGHSCQNCGKTFAFHSRLKTHCQRAHRTTPQYACELCQAVFPVKRQLATHLHTHREGQPYRCDVCGMDFGTREYLRKHSACHTGQRPHACQICGRAFFHKGHLKQHMMIHSGARPHRCTECEKSFVFKFDLNRHLKLHSERESSDVAVGAQELSCQETPPAAPLSGHESSASPEQETIPTVNPGDQMIFSPSQAAVNPNTAIPILSPQQQSLLLLIAAQGMLQQQPQFANPSNQEISSDPHPLVFPKTCNHGDNCDSCRDSFSDLKKQLERSKHEAQLYLATIQNLGQLLMAKQHATFPL